MKHLINYIKFNEALYKVEPTDAPEFAVDKTNTNKLQADIKEFLTKKTVIDNIYLTYKDEKDLISKLYAQKFIPANTSNKKRIQFINPLIGFYAQASEKKRQLRSLEDELQNKKDDISSKNSLMVSNPDTKDALQNDVDYTQTKIGEINDKISKIKNEIVSLERSTEKKLKEMKLNMTTSKKRLDYFINSKDK